MFVDITLVDFVLQWMHFVSLYWKYPILCVSFHILHHFIFISDITTLTRPGAGTWKDVPSRARALWVKQGLCKQIRRQRESQWGSERARESQREPERVRDSQRENQRESLWLSPALSLALWLDLPLSVSVSGSLWSMHFVWCGIFAKHTALFVKKNYSSLWAEDNGMHCVPSRLRILSCSATEHNFGWL